MLAIAALLAHLAVAPALAADLTIRLCGMESRTGAVRVKVFAESGAAEFTDALAEGYAAAFAVRLADHEPNAVVRVTLNSLLPGRYAISAYHDANSNGVFDRGGLVGTPEEAYGYSKGARARVAAVDFDEAAFVLGGGELSVDVRIAPWKITGGDGSPCPP